jgi:hypothetical protein
MDKTEISHFIKTDPITKGIKITNMEATLTHIERILELLGVYKDNVEMAIRFYVQGYASGVQSQAK